jgi:hypothetical protein
MVCLIELFPGWMTSHFWDLPSLPQSPDLIAPDYFFLPQRKIVPNKTQNLTGTKGQHLQRNPYHSAGHTAISAGVCCAMSKILCECPWLSLITHHIQGIICKWSISKCVLSNFLHCWLKYSYDLWQTLYKQKYLLYLPDVMHFLPPKIS